MCKWTKTAGLLFAATASVYAVGATAAIAAGQPGGATPATPGSTEVRVLAEQRPAAADGAGSVVTPLDETDATAPAATSQPSAGRSVTASEVNVSPAGTVEIHVNDASLVEVLRMLSLQSQRNIIASKDVRGTVTANLYDVTVREALDAILQANGFGYRERGNFIYVYTAKELAEIEKAERKVKTEVFHLYYTPAANAATMIKPVLSADAQVALTTPAASGVETGTTDVGGNSHASDDVLVVTDYPENLERARKVLQEVDRRPQQILIEATILRASLNEDNALGVDFTVLGGVDFRSLSLVNSADPAQGTGLAQALDGRILENADAGPLNDHGFAAGSVGGSGLSVGLVKNSVGMFIQALEGITDTVVLANPKVLALNKQKGEVIVGRKDGYLTSTVTQTTTVQTVEFLETGTRLVFRPFIGDDGYIRMEIHPEDSSGGLNNSLPFKVTTEVTSNVMVKDGHTIVIGGLFREDTTTQRSQVPFLGNLPLAGPLFRRKEDQTKREEVIILLTPHIVKDDVAYSQLSSDELKQAEKLRIGIRHGLMPWGRSRLAESEYECAVNIMNGAHPDRQRALWHLNAATNLNPKFIEAINMKEALTGRVVTLADGSIIRDFVSRAILEDLPPLTTQPARDANPPVVPIEPTPTAPPPATTEPAAATEPAAMMPPEAAAPGETEPAAAVADTASSLSAAEAVPATQPVAAIDTPATRPVAEAAPATQPAVADSEPGAAPAPADAEAADAAAAPQPGSSNDTVVTELPIDDLGVNGSADRPDDNK